MSEDKVVSLSEAIQRYVADGMTIAVEGFSHLIPFAAAHEIIRQKKRNLTICRMTPDIVTDQLVAAGCVSHLIASFFASGSAGSLYEIRRRIEHGVPERLTVEEYSHFGMVSRYHAGASGIPFAPLRSYSGSDLPRLNPRITTVDNPYGEGSVYVVPSLNPDVTIVHAQRSDRRGNVQMWGILGAQQQAAFAGKTTIVVVEKVVDDEVVRGDPNRTIIPSHVIDAIVECPRGAHPSYAQGYYDRDNDFYRSWTAISKDPVRLQKWLREWVYDVSGPAEYCEKLGPGKWETLSADVRMSEPVNYGSGRS
ncbi:CoA transferase subunit A [soil metagenome]